MVPNVTHLYWHWLKRSGLTNLGVNQVVRRISDTDLKDTGVPTPSLDITREEYQAALQSDYLAFYRNYEFAHRKVLEYLVSWKLARSLSTVRRFCDFAGGKDAFAAWLRNTHYPEAESYAVDPLLAAESHVSDHVTHVRGDARDTHLVSDSLDLITCHHSIEHFQDDQDTAAVREFARALRPGGMAVITPIFLATKAHDIWNRTPPRGSPPPEATRIIDRTSPFPGWGPFEGFARVYSLQSFHDRIVSPLSAHGTLQLYRVTYDGLPCPDTTLNRGLPQFCERMLSLCFLKS